MHISEEWTDLIDRGGLIHISDNLFFLFTAMEVEVRSHFNVTNPTLLKSGLKERIATSVLQNEDVQCYWSMVTANWEEKDAESDELLAMIINHWIVIRGFSFTSSLILMKRTRSIRKPLKNPKEPARL